MGRTMRALTSADRDRINNEIIAAEVELRQCMRKFESAWADGTPANALADKMRPAEEKARKLKATISRLKTQLRNG